MADHEFDLTVDETTAKTVVDDFAGARKAASALHAHDQIVAGEDVTGWTPAHDEHVADVCDAAVDVVQALAGSKGKARVSVNGDSTHANISVQVLK